MESSDRGNIYGEESQATRMNSRISEMKKRHISELRESLIGYKTLTRRDNKNLDYSKLPNNINMIVFGPSKSGKSSLIKTFYQALYNTTTLPKEYDANLIIQKLTNTEGTKKFTKFILKKEKKNVVKTETTQIVTETSQINLYDTRGQILMNDNEIQQMELIMEGKVRDMTIVEQRAFRYAYLLWEFWRRDSELFPKEIMADGGLESRPHVILFVFDGSIEQVPNGDEEALFYKNILQKARQKNYFYPQIVLTKVDQVEEKIRNSLKNSNLDSYEIEAKLREAIDMKIEQVVVKLGVPRESVHFIENYHETKYNQDIEVDYYALKLLDEALKQGDNYFENSLPTLSTCSIF